MIVKADMIECKSGRKLGMMTVHAVDTTDALQRMCELAKTQNPKASVSKNAVHPGGPGGDQIWVLRKPEPAN